METLVLLVLAGAAWLWWRHHRAARIERVEELTMMAGDMEQVAAELKALQMQLMAAAEQENYPEAIRLGERCLELVDERLGSDPEIVLPLLDALANFHDLAGQPEQSIPVLEQSTGLRETLPQQLEELCSSLARLATLYLARGEQKEAQRCFKREMELLRRLGRADSPDMLGALRGMIALNLDDARVADTLRQQFRDTARRLPRDVAANLLNEANDLFMQAMHAGENREAWLQVDAAALLADVLLGPLHETTLTCRANLAEMLRRNHRLEEADQLFRQLIALHEKQPDDPSTPAALSALFGNMALLCDELARVDEAAQWRQRQSEVQGAGGVSTSSRFNSLNNLAVSYSRQGREADAAAAFAEALALAPEGEDIAPTLWADVLNNYGATLVTLGRLPEAGRIYQQVLARKKAGVDIPLPQLAATLNGLGMVYDTLGKLPQALDMFTRALKLKEKFLKPGDASLETAWHNLGSACARSGETDRAVELGRLVLASREKRLGAGHPETRTARMNLDTVLAQQERDKPATREQVDTLMVQVTGGELRRYATFDFGRARDESVSMVLVPESSALSLQYKLMRALPPGWRCHVGSTRWLGEEKHDGQAELVAIPSASQFDCLRVARTDAINHDMETEDVIRVLEDYHRRFGIRIVAAETDSVAFHLLRLPEDLNAFAEELLEFCMDLEDVSLILPMLTAPGRLISLWWD